MVNTGDGIINGQCQGNNGNDNRAIENGWTLHQELFLLFLCGCFLSHHEHTNDTYDYKYGAENKETKCANVMVTKRMTLIHTTDNQGNHAQGNHCVIQDGILHLDFLPTSSILSEFLLRSCRSDSIVSNE